MKYKIPYGRQSIDQRDIDAVIETLQHDFLTQGPKVKEFEDAFAEYVGAKYAVAVTNGTAALHLAALSLDLKPGQKIITTPITFAASANAMLYCGAEIDFCDIDRNTYVMDFDKLEEKLANAPAGTYAGVVPVDFTGLPVDTERLSSIADKYNLWIIEDACHAPGGYFIDSKGEKIACGNGKYADATCFSFHPVKHIACGEGGMITTDNEKTYKRLMMLRTHGITKEDMIEDHGGWYHEMHVLGYNYRIPDINCALGLSQLQKADQGLERRFEIAATYDEAFAGETEIKVQLQPDNFQNAYHLYVIEVADRKGLYDYLRTKGIFAQIHYIPCHTHPYYRNLGWQKGDFPQAEDYYAHCISLPMYPTLTEEEQSYIIQQVKTFING